MNVYSDTPLITSLIYIFKAPKNLFLNHFDYGVLESTMRFCTLRSTILFQKFIEMKLSLSVYSVNDLLWVKCSCHTLLAHSEQDKCCQVVSVKAALDLPLTLLVFHLFTCLSDTRMNSLLSDMFHALHTYKETLRINFLNKMLHFLLFTCISLNGGLLKTFYMSNITLIVVR